MLATTNRKISVVLIIVGIAFIILSYRLPEYPLVPVDADAVPIFLGYLLIFLSIILFFTKDEVTEQHEEDGTEEDKPKSILMNENTILIVFGISIVLYIFLLELLGFLITTAIFIFAMTLLFGYRKHVTNAIVSLSIPVGFYYLFSVVLKISLPKGILPF